MNPEVWQHFISRQGAPLRLALMLLLCGLFSWSAAQPDRAEAGKFSGFVGQLEQLAQCIPSDRLHSRFGAREQDSDQWGDDFPDLYWATPASAITAADIHSVANSHIFNLGEHLPLALKHSPGNPRAPPVA